MDSGTPAGEEGGVEEALVKEMGKYIAAFIFDDNDLGKDITSRVIELKEGERADRSIQVSVAKVDGSGYFSLENGALTLAALPPKPAEQAGSGSTDEENREVYEIFPGVGEVTLEFRKGDRVLPLNIMIRIVEPGTEGSRSAVDWSWPRKVIFQGYDKINESFMRGFPILSRHRMVLIADIEVVKKTDSSGEEVRLNYIDPHLLGILTEFSFSCDVLSPAAMILELYGTHLLQRISISADGELLPPNDDDLIPIWEIVPYTVLLSTNWVTGPQKAAEIKQEYERQMALKNQP
jgi:hypothetical protein